MAGSDPLETAVPLGQLMPTLAEPTGPGRSGVTRTGSDRWPLLDRLGHAFANPVLLDGALTHPSALGRKGQSRGPASFASFERLEFLGDRVLGLVVAQVLMERFPEESEGDLARRHAVLVRNESLQTVADSVDLMSHLRQADAAQRRDRVAVLADAIEALIAALYLDGGLPAAEAFIRREWNAMIDAPPAPPQDAKTGLQEWAQARALPLPTYAILANDGPAHAPKFTVRVIVEGFDPADGFGRSKRAAEQEAAGKLLNRLRADGS